MRTFICFILKQCGVLIQILYMRETFVSMLIIGKILEESHIYMNMKESNALNGKLKTLFKHMQMGVNMNIDVNTLMDGKNRNIILLIISCIHVDNKKFVKNLIVLIITLKRIEDIL